MPPMQTGKVDFPEDWSSSFDACQASMSGPVVLGGLSVFDGAPRKTRRISESMSASGLPTMSMDVSNPTENSTEQDILQEAGEATFLANLASLKKDSLVWLAPPCKSWGFLPRSQTKRSKRNPRGASLAWVLQGNEQAEFVAKALLAATFLGRRWTNY